MQASPIGSRSSAPSASSSSPTTTAPIGSSSTGTSTIFLGKNPFGFSSQNLGSLYKGARERHVRDVQALAQDDAHASPRRRRSRQRRGPPPFEGAAGAQDRPRLTALIGGSRYSIRSTVSEVRDRTCSEPHSRTSGAPQRRRPPVRRSPNESRRSRSPPRPDLQSSGRADPHPPRSLTTPLALPPALADAKKTARSCRLETTVR